MADITCPGTAGLLERLSLAVGLSGHEAGIASIVSEAFGPLCDETRLDRLGNFMGLKRGDGPEPRPRAMFAAHMDEIGLIVTKIDEKGFLRFSNIGGVDPRVLPGLQVLVHGGKPLPGVIGAKPPHILRPDELSEAARMEDMYIDTGLPAGEAHALIHVGDVVSFRPSFARMGDMVYGKSLDDRAGVAVLYECLVRLKSMKHSSDVFVVATVQEETRLSGAIVSTFGLKPDVGIAVDVTHGDMPGVGEHQSSKLDKGPALSIGPNVHPKVYERLQAVARDHSVPVQVEVSPASTGTDAWAMQVTRSGVATGVISIPLRYMHTPVETGHLSDIAQAGRLAAHFAASLDSAFVEGLRCY